jgi:hypothetical protein
LSAMISDGMPNGYRYDFRCEAPKCLHNSGHSLLKLTQCYKPKNKVSWS